MAEADIAGLSIEAARLALRLKEIDAQRQRRVAGAAQPRLLGEKVC